MASSSLNATPQSSHAVARLATPVMSDDVTAVGDVLDDVDSCGAEGSLQKLCSEGWLWTGDGCGDGAGGMTGMELTEAGGEKVWCGRCC